MTSNAILLVLTSIAFSAIAQILMKLGMSAASAREAMAAESVLGSYVVIFRQPYVIAGLACYVLATLVWLRVLSSLDVSKAYPFIALSIVATMTFGALFLGETLSPTRVLGGALIAVGVIVVGMS